MRKTVSVLCLFCCLQVAFAQDVIYRCGNEYVNNLTPEQAKSCKKVSPADPDPSRWLFIASSNDARTYVEKKAPTREGTYLKKWFLFSYKTAQTNSKGEEYRSAKLLYVFDCKSWTLGNKGGIRYLDSVGDGTSIQNHSRSLSETSFDDPVPESVAEALIENVCGKRK